MGFVHLTDRRGKKQRKKKKKAVKTQEMIETNSRSWNLPEDRHKAAAPGTTTAPCGPGLAAQHRRKPEGPPGPGGPLRQRPPSPPRSAAPRTGRPPPPRVPVVPGHPDPHSPSAAPAEPSRLRPGAAAVAGRKPPPTGPGAAPRLPRTYRLPPRPAAGKWRPQAEPEPARPRVAGPARPGPPRRSVAPRSSGQAPPAPRPRTGDAAGRGAVGEGRRRRRRLWAGIVVAEPPGQVVRVEGGEAAEGPHPEGGGKWLLFSLSQEEPPRDQYWARRRLTASYTIWVRGSSAPWWSLLVTANWVGKGTLQKGSQATGRPG